MPEHREDGIGPIPIQLICYLCRLADNNLRMVLSLANGYQAFNEENTL